MKRNGIERLPVNGQRWVGATENGEGLDGHNGASRTAQKIEQSISYMLQHLNEPLQVATLAAVVNFSPSHYSALFKRWMGCPPIDYFIHLRMQQACRLFESTSLNVKEVAAALGYDDPFYFSRLFKSVNRLAPTEYRQKKIWKPQAGLDGAEPCSGYERRIPKQTPFQPNNNHTKFNENHSFVHSQTS